MDETKNLSETEGSQALFVGLSESTDSDPCKIGRYRIIRRLGQGGFGRVYLAHDDELDRPVAIKVPNPERISAPEDVEAFLTEARILARLDHPNIVPVFDVGRTEDGLCFVVSKLVEGSDLAVRIGQGRPSFRHSAELVATIAEASFTLILVAWSTAMSNLPTSSSMSQVNRVLPISDLPSKTRTMARVEGWLELPRI